jgi:putative ABC transport system permease protein
LLASTGIATASLLVVALTAAYRGATAGVVAYVGQQGFDLWVAPRGIDNLVRSAGQLAPGAEAIVRALPGVAEVGPILRTFAMVEAGPEARRRRLTMLAIGYRCPDGLGGPPQVVAGRRPAARDEVVIDRAAAYRLGIGPGGALDVAGDAMRIVGITRRTNLLATQFAFGDYGATEDALGAFERPSFLVVRLSPGAKAANVAQAIVAALPRASVFGRADFVRNNVREIASGILPMLVLVSGLGMAVAVALVALLAQGLAEDRRGDVAVLFALGAPARTVAAGVLVHVEKVVLLGAGAGALAAWVLALAMERLVPTVELAWRAADLVLAPMVFGAASAIAALGPVMRLRRIDPLEAFRP